MMSSTSSAGGAFLEVVLILRSAMMDDEVARASAAAGGISGTSTLDWKGSGDNDDGLSKYDLPDDLATGWSDVIVGLGT